MKNPSDHNQLLDDLLGDDFRAESLTHALAAARRARRSRRARRCISCTAAVIMVAAAAIPLFQHRPRIPAPDVVPRVELKSAIKIISEEELLAQFPGRAVGIVGPPEHRQLVFLDTR